MVYKKKGSLFIENHVLRTADIPAFVYLNTRIPSKNNEIKNSWGVSTVAEEADMDEFSHASGSKLGQWAALATRRDITYLQPQSSSPSWSYGLTNSLAFRGIFNCVCVCML